MGVTTSNKELSTSRIECGGSFGVKLSLSAEPDIMSNPTDIANNIAKPGATDIVITEKLNPCFRILSVTTPAKGTASLIDANTLRWEIDKLGVKESEGALAPPVFSGR